MTQAVGKSEITVTQAVGKSEITVTQAVGKWDQSDPGCGEE